MSRRKKYQLPFDRRGDVIVIQKILLSSVAYMTLRPQAKVLLQLLQVHWRHFKPVDYGIREAQEKIPCSRKTAMKAFNQLQERGFIECIEESWFSSRTKSRSRSWRLTWLPYKDKAPTNEWEDWKSEKNHPV